MPYAPVAQALNLNTVTVRIKSEKSKHSLTDDPNTLLLKKGSCLTTHLDTCNQTFK